MRAPRVLVLGAVLGQPAGGVRRRAAELLPRAARLLAEEGGRLAVLEGRTPLAFDLPPEALRLASDVPARPPLVRAFHEGRALAAALEQARRAGEPFDLVHTAHLPAPRRPGAPLVLTVHDLRAIAGAHTPFSRRLVAGRVVGAAVRNAARVVAVSEAVRAELLARFRLAPERIALVPNAADHLAPLPRERTPDAPLLHLGHLERRKNLELVLRALALDPALPNLVLAGAAKHGEEERLRVLAGELGVADRVRFAGPVEDDEARRLLARCAAVVLPSRLEGFGIVALEALRAGAPLAVSAIPAHLEVTGGTAATFPPDDPALCAAAIRAALEADEARLAAGRAQVERYRWDDSARLLVAAWREAAMEASERS